MGKNDDFNWGPSFMDLNGDHKVSLYERMYWDGKTASDSPSAAGWRRQSNKNDRAPRMPPGNIYKIPKWVSKERYTEINKYISCELWDSIPMIISFIVIFPGSIIGLFIFGVLSFENVASTIFALVCIAAAIVSFIFGKFFLDDAIFDIKLKRKYKKLLLNDMTRWQYFLYKRQLIKENIDEYGWLYAIMAAVFMLTLLFILANIH